MKKAKKRGTMQKVNEEQLDILLAEVDYQQDMRVDPLTTADRMRSEVEDLERSKKQREIEKAEAEEKLKQEATDQGALAKPGATTEGALESSEVSQNEQSE